MIPVCISDHSEGGLPVVLCKEISAVNMKISRSSEASQQIRIVRAMEFIQTLSV